jgi:hypothetical protein
MMAMETMQKKKRKTYERCKSEVKRRRECRKWQQKI